MDSVLEGLSVAGVRGGQPIDFRGGCVVDAATGVPITQASYRTVHRWLDRFIGKTGRCSRCGVERHTQWCYIGPGHRDAQRRYSLTLAEYVECCVPCHRAIDGLNPEVNARRSATMRGKPHPARHPRCAPGCACGKHRWNGHGLRPGRAI